MRVTVESIEEFITCLDAEKALFDGVLRVQRSSNPIDSQDRNKAARHRVDIHFSTVVCMLDGTQYILEGAEACGVDYTDANQRRTGSEKADLRINKIKEYAEKRGWRVLPGRIHE